MTRLDTLFTITYGNKFDFNKMDDTKLEVAFIGRRGSNQGLSGHVGALPGVKPYPAGLITVALGGSYVLAAFVQQEPFYTAQNVAVLRPLTDMSLSDRLYYAACITANRYRYTAFGREANRTLRALEVPESTPSLDSQLATPLAPMIAAIPAISKPEIGASSPGGLVKDLFAVRYGQSLELNRLTRCAAPDGVNFVSRTDRNNGVSARVRVPDELSLGMPGELSVALGGSPLATFLQTEEFVCGRDVAILTTRKPMTDAEKLWFCVAIRANRYRYSYGRQANRTLAEIPLPAFPNELLAGEAVDTVLDSLRAALVEAIDEVS